jgi:uncharacterized membrane protein (DUF4010 family)
VNELATQSFIDGMIAAGLGLFIGLEREHREMGEAAGDEAAPAGSTPKEPPEDMPDHLGVRTFALVALLGWLFGLLERWVPNITLVGLVVAGALIALQYVRTWREGAGITTEVAALVTFGLGLLVQQNRLLAVALALTVTLLLFAKPWVRLLVANIERRELTATLQLAIMMAIVLPVLPATPVDPWGVLPPRKLGLFVVLIAGINFVGYVLSRLFGARRGAGLSGLLGGLASSTAVTAAMSQRARETPAMVVPAQLATFLANAVMFARVMVVVAVLSRATAWRLAIPMACMGAVMLGAAGWKWRAFRREGDSGGDGDQVPLENPFALLPALKWGALLAAILVVATIAHREFGTRGLVLAAALTGFADVDAPALAVSRQVAGGGLTVDTAVLAITAAAVANTLTKAGVAVVSGGWRFGRAVAAVFALAIAAGLAAALIV